MQSVSGGFDGRAKGAVRKLFWRLLMSFDRIYLSSVSFFTIGVSTIGGSDIIKGEGDVIQEWDKYQYQDYSNRIISYEWTRQEDQITSVALSTADIVLNNYDRYFTPNAGSPIQNYILPYRPIKLYAGFGIEAVPVFVGLTEKMPVIDEKTKRASFHCIDFLYSLMNRPLDQAVIYQTKRTDEILAGLLQLAGLSATQYSLDTGYNVVAFAFFDKGTKLGDAIKELMEAEMGRFYMDETGVLRFKNRQNYSSTPVYYFDKSKVIDFATRKQDDIVNVVEVKAKVREVQAKQKFWELQSATVVPAGSSVDIWADFEDPVTSVDTPAYITSATTSLYTTNAASDGSGDPLNTAISLGISAFAKSYKMTFTNSGSVPVYITSIELWATPAKIVKEIYVRETDVVSIAKYDERVLTIENNFINNDGDATSKAKILIDDYSVYAPLCEMVVKGNPALQLGDAVRVAANIDGGGYTYVITKIVGRMLGSQFTQVLTVKRKTFRTYFTIGVSTIGGSDVIAP